MISAASINTTRAEITPSSDDFRAEFVEGLRRQPKTLSCKFFYDEYGSRLFDKICELDEYYLTRTETEILTNNIQEIAALGGPACTLIEFGSGSSRKTRLLLDRLEAPTAYVPIDISETHLLAAAKALSASYPSLEVLPVCADYSNSLALPIAKKMSEKQVVFFSGSTIGNFEPEHAVKFLNRIATFCKAGDGLLIGVDLEKSPNILHRAYNDSNGITAAFNLNLLGRANRELGANFQIQNFRHEAIYNSKQHRIEMRLVSCLSQEVTVSPEEFLFHEGEIITTEYSYKYKAEAFHSLAARAGWRNKRMWIDERGLYSVHYFELCRNSFLNFA